MKIVEKVCNTLPKMTSETRRIRVLGGPVNLKKRPGSCSPVCSQTPLYVSPQKDMDIKEKARNISVLRAFRL
jgi:hypothetical protein